MSLVQRVTAIEGTDREPLPQEWLHPTSTINQTSHLHSAQAHHPTYGTWDTASIHSNVGSVAWRHNLREHGSIRSLRRVISYDAFAKPVIEPLAVPVSDEGVPAYDVSTYRRLAQVVITILTCWLAAGIVFGYAALKPVLVSQGVYRELCTVEELADNVEVCYEQDLRLSLFFAVATTTCNVSAIVVGAISDRYGARIAACLGAVFLAIGSVLMALAFSIPEFDGYLLGNMSLSLGGTFVFVPAFSMANAFPMYSGLIVATVTGAFDASAAVFLFYRLAYEASNGTFTPEKFFLGYLLVPVVIVLTQVFLMSSDDYQTVPQLEQKLEKQVDVTLDVHDSDEDLSDGEVRRLRAQRRDHRESAIREIDSVLGDADFREAREHKEEEIHVKSGVWGVLHGRSPTQQMLSPWFILITLLTVLQMMRMNFFIATIKSQYEYMLGSEHAARKINSFFDVALPVGGVITTPIIGLLLDNLSTADMLSVLVALITVVGILGSLPYVWAAYSNIILFVILRPLYYSAMSDYAAKIFGFATFGRVYGAIICLSGLVNLAQPAMAAANHDIFNDNPIPINVILSVFGTLFGIILVLYVRIQGRRTIKKQVMMEVAERQRLIPESIREDESEADFA